MYVGQMRATLIYFVENIKMCMISMSYYDLLAFYKGRHYGTIPGFNLLVYYVIALRA